jgi:PDZ domain-containing protein
MKTKSIATIAALLLLPIAAFAQPSPPVPPPPPGPPPTGPVGPGNDRDRDRHEKKVPVTYLGVETDEIPPVVSEQLGLQKGFGLVVEYVVPDGPAAAAGIQQNDILKMLNDQILTERDQLSKLVRSFPEGTTVTFTVLRKGKEEKIGVKLSKKEVSERSEMWGRHPHFNFNFNGHDWGDFGMGNLKEQMDHLKEQLGDTNSGVIHDAIMTAQAEAQRALAEQRKDLEHQRRDMEHQMRDQARQIRDQARDEARRARDEARRNAGITVNQTRDGGMSTTKIDMGKAQIVYSDDKGELRVEKIDGKKVLTAKDPKGLLQFSGPVETKEDLDKVPADVRARYEKLQNNDLPAVISEHQSEMDNDTDVDEEDSDQADTDSMNQVCTKPTGQPVNYTFVKI